MHVPTLHSNLVPGSALLGDQISLFFIMNIHTLNKSVTGHPHGPGINDLIDLVYVIINQLILHYASDPASFIFKQDAKVSLMNNDYINQSAITQ